MKNIIAAILAALAGAKKLVLKAVRRAGQIVLELVAAPAPMLPAIAPSIADDADNTVSDMPDETILSLRRVMRAYLVGERPDPEMLRSLPQTTRDWVRCLDQRQIQILMSAGDDQVTAHLLSTQPIRGVARHDAETAAEMLRLRDMGKADKISALEARVARRRRQAVEASRR